MARKKGVAVQSDDDNMLPFDDAEMDLESASQLMINRERFDSLSTTERARLAEAMLAMPFKGMMETGGVKGGDIAAVEDAFQKFFGGALDAVESNRTTEGCYLCHMPFVEDDDKVEQHLTWVADGRKVYGEPTGESAHGRCVKRVREGGDAGEKPLF